MPSCPQLLGKLLQGPILSGVELGEGFLQWRVQIVFLRVQKGQVQGGDLLDAEPLLLGVGTQGSLQSGGRFQGDAHLVRFRLAAIRSGEDLAENFEILLYL